MEPTNAEVEELNNLKAKMKSLAEKLVREAERITVQDLDDMRTKEGHLISWDDESAVFGYPDLYENIDQ